jgi:GABA permease
MLQMHEAQMSSASQLRRGLSQRQLNMIALGGVIGAGLFVGSGVIIGETGPGAFITPLRAT